MNIKAIIIIVMGLALILYHVIKNRSNPEYFKTVLKMALPIIAAVIVLAIITSFF